MEAEGSQQALNCGGVSSSTGGVVAPKGPLGDGEPCGDMSGSAPEEFTVIGTDREKGESCDLGLVGRMTPGGRVMDPEPGVANDEPEAVSPGLRPGVALATGVVGTIPFAGKPATLGLLRGLTPPAPAAGTNPESGFESRPEDEMEPGPPPWLRLGDPPPPTPEADAPSLGEERKLASSADEEPPPCGFASKLKSETNGSGIKSLEEKAAQLAAEFCVSAERGALAP